MCSAPRWRGLRCGSCGRGEREVRDDAADAGGVLRGAGRGAQDGASDRMGCLKPARSPTSWCRRRLRAVRGALPVPARLLPGGCPGSWHRGTWLACLADLSCLPLPWSVPAGGARRLGGRRVTPRCTRSAPCQRSGSASAAARPVPRCGRRSAHAGQPRSQLSASGSDRRGFGAEPAHRHHRRRRARHESGARPFTGEIAAGRLVAPAVQHRWRTTVVAAGSRGARRGPGPRRSSSWLSARPRRRSWRRCRGRVTAPGVGVLTLRPPRPAALIAALDGGAVRRWRPVRRSSWPRAPRRAPHRRRRSAALPAGRSGHGLQSAVPGEHHTATAGRRPHAGCAPLAAVRRLLPAADHRGPAVDPGFRAPCRAGSRPRAGCPLSWLLL